MMSSAYSVWKTQSPRFRIELKVCMPGTLKLASVAGNMRRLEAKIGGIMLAMFTLSGRCAVCPP